MISLCPPNAQERKTKLTTSVKSPNASPLSTELIRTARSRIPSGAGWSSALRTSERASAFLCGVTLSSRSYATQSAVRERDLSIKRWEEPGTVRLVSIGALLRMRCSVWGCGEAGHTVEKGATECITGCHVATGHGFVRS